MKSELQQLGGVAEGLKLVCMDIQLNENEKIRIQRVPAIVVYLKGEKNRGYQYIEGGVGKWLSELMGDRRSDL